ncbi:MAG: thioredoxin family protein [Methanolobus sp.]|nr:thioredoxin family protein [Methanolobus sp.]
MNRTILELTFLVTFLLLFSGCVDIGGSDTNTSSQENAGLVEVSSLGDIDQALVNGPVLVEMGYDGCPACIAQEPIMEEIAAEYQGKADVLHIDTKNAGPLARQFGVDYVPDSFVIVDGEEGQYVYMKADGQTTTDRSGARFVGLTRKDNLAATLDKAIELRQGG